VEYELSRLGRTLLVPIQSLAEWAAENRTVIQEAREGYDRRIKRAPRRQGSLPGG
jgi:DNA-binding HxlR family transcriptional regulator